MPLMSLSSAQDGAVGVQRESGVCWTPCSPRPSAAPWNAGSETRVQGRLSLDRKAIFLSPPFFGILLVGIVSKSSSEGQPTFQGQISPLMLTLAQSSLAPSHHYPKGDPSASSHTPVGCPAL